MVSEIITLIENKNDRDLLDAAENGSVTGAGKALAKGAFIEARDRRGYTPLAKAAWKKQDSVVKFLLAKGAAADSVHVTGYTPLHLAVRRRGSLSTVKLLVEAGADVHTRNRHTQGLLTTAVISCSRGNYDVLRYLIKKGIDVNRGNEFNTTPLMVSSYLGRTGAMKILLDAGAGVDVRDTFGRTPLMQAALHGKHEAMKLLLENHADVNAIANSEKKLDYKRTSLMFAAKSYRKEESGKAVEILLKAGAKIDERDDGNNTALIHAVMSNNSFAVKTLLSKGADKAAKNAVGQTALDLAKSSGCNEIVKLLK